MKQIDSFQQAIQSYLEHRAKTDELFAKSFTKPKKSIEQCCAYILGEAKKRGNAVAISDAEVFGMAVHYYDEDDIKVNKMPANIKASVSNTVPLTKIKQEQKPEPARKSKAVKREIEDPRQMSLF